MLLSIIIPVYNEEKTILEIIKRIEKVELKNVKKEIIIIDDKSTDNTPKLLKKLNRHTVIYRKKNGGEGAALRDGYKIAKGDIIVNQDADLEYNPEDYKKMIRPILSGEHEVVYGSRFLSVFEPRYKLYYLGNIFLSFLVRIIYGVKLTDMETCYKMFKRDVIKGIELKCNGFDIEPEITVKLIKKGYKILEVPIQYKSRSFDEGKKVTSRDGLKAAWFLIKHRFVN